MEHGGSRKGGGGWEVLGVCVTADVGRSMACPMSGRQCCCEVSRIQCHVSLLMSGQIHGVPNIRERQGREAVRRLPTVSDARWLWWVELGALKTAQPGAQCTCSAVRPHLRTG